MSEIVVIEGLGGVGKTTTAQNLARMEGYTNRNSGTPFRGMAAGALLLGIHESELVDFVHDAHANLKFDLKNPLYPQVALSGLDVSDMLQSPDVTSLAARIGSYPDIASLLETTANASLSGTRQVFEGKHISDRVQADYRFYFIARREVRVRRKLQQAQAAGNREYSFLKAQHDIVVNDQKDKRLLEIKAGTHIIDTTELSPEQVVGAVLRRINQAERIRQMV